MTGCFKPAQAPESPRHSPVAPGAHTDTGPPRPAGTWRDQAVAPRVPPADASAAPTLPAQLVLLPAPAGLRAGQRPTQLLQLLLVLQVRHAQLGAQGLDLRQQAAPVRQAEVLQGLLLQTARDGAGKEGSRVTDSATGRPRGGAPPEWGKGSTSVPQGGGGRARQRAGRSTRGAHPLQIRASSSGARAWGRSLVPDRVRTGSQEGSVTSTVWNRGPRGPSDLTWLPQVYATGHRDLP